VVVTPQLRAAVNAPVDPNGNPVWHALAGPQADYAEATGEARRYRPEVSVFCALPDAPTADDWDALRALVGPGEHVFLIRESVDVPNGWIPTFELAGVQMALETTIAPGDVPDHLPLTHADVPEMTELVSRTEPGPWRPRTIDLGTYLGVRDDGTLVAMAGQRMRPPGFTEISAVCTDPAYRGRGLASGLTRAIAALIESRGERPMLHAATNNETAVRLYRSLGFRRTRDMVGVQLRAPD
jgi:GNAT superfamily N-acetyltransferase